MVAHVVNSVAFFAAVYDPSASNLWTAYKGKGALLNGEKLSVKRESTQKIILKVSDLWKDESILRKISSGLVGYEVEYSTYSCAVNHGLVASGQYDGVIDLAKDSFPEFAGGLIVREAGGQFTNIEGHSEIQPSDRIFIGGNPETYPKLFSLVKGAL